MEKKNDGRSLAMLVASMVIFGSIGIFRRALPVSSAALACFRGASGALLMAAAAKLRGRRLLPHAGARTTALLILSGALMGCNWILLFEAYSATTVATATLCYYMEPSLVILLSPLVFGERITLKRGLCVLASAAGMICGKTILQLLSAAAALVPYLLVCPPELPAQWTIAQTALLLVVGFVHTGLAYALWFGCMDGLRAQTVALFSYLDPVTALVLAALVLHERMTPAGIAGAVLILGAALFSEFSPGRRGPSAEEETP